MTLIVASLTWASGALMPDPRSMPNVELAVGDRPGFIVSWAQQVDQPPIEQTGEGTQGDVETLDEGAPPVADQSATDVETLDAGPAPVEETLDAGLPPAAQGDDIELLDQGAPPATTGAVDTIAVDTTTHPVDTVYVAPAAESAPAYVDPGPTYYAPEPAVAHGPVIPEGFGTSRVQAVAGRSAIPPGLEDCHVGSVTGRAYVGIDCGDGTSVVGHAPSFEEFPFTGEADFPFDGDEAFFAQSADFPFGDDDELAVAVERQAEDDTATDIFVSAGRGARELFDEDADVSVTGIPGTTSVQFAQRARERDPRARVEERGTKKAKKSDNGRQDNGSTASGDDANSRPNTESATREDRQNRQVDGQVAAENKEKKSKKVKEPKKSEDRKEKKERKEGGR